MDPCCAVSDWAARQREQALSFLPPFHSPWLLLCAKCISCPKVLCSSPSDQVPPCPSAHLALGAPTSLQSHPLCVAVAAQGKGGEQKHGWWGPDTALHCCRCGGSGLEDGSMGSWVVHALLPWFIAPGRMVTVATPEEQVPWLTEQARTAPLPLLPASHQLFISQKIRDNQLCPLAVPSPSPRAGTQCGARADPSPCQAGDPCPCHSLVVGYLHQLHLSSVFCLRSICLLVSIGSCLAQTAK